MEVLSSLFQDTINEVQALFNASAATVVTEHNVYQPGEQATIPFVDKIIDGLILPGSGINGMEHLSALLDKARAGKSCLLLLEHYSNLDLPLFSYLLRNDSERGKEVADALVAVAGIKLNEASPTVAAFTSAYTRLVIYPSRSLQGLDSEKDRDELIRVNTINRAAMKALLTIKTTGKLLLVFPSGTRYRPWDLSSKKGVREIDSYIKSFDLMCLVAINGVLLHVREDDSVPEGHIKGDMMDDYVSRGVVQMTAGPVLSCADFRNAARARAEASGVEDKKQASVDALMEALEVMHNTPR
ncbi:MAG: 1-acyl-sn-glycerol-3-phosphate acyltransferase [Treponema sp.]|jgi:glycerol-3-phosphate O-acyltransferase|nr:1-acyl-sn-glycerol-3-phosphate acyltransferase [Treponema sp.]